jgi:hypothetical protein
MDERTTTGRPGVWQSPQLQQQQQRVRQQPQRQEPTAGGWPRPSASAPLPEEIPPTIIKKSWQGTVRD